MPRCPICQRGTTTRFAPFCSLRCADLDLGQWLKGQYRVPSTREEDISEIERALLEKDDDAP